MEELPRVDPNEDPYLALRTSLAVAVCLLLSEPLGITMPMLPALFGMIFMSNQRGALTPRTFVIPVMLPIIAIVFSWTAAVTVNEPMVFIALNSLLAVGGMSLALFRGSKAGMMLTVFPLMMAMAALTSDFALAAIKDSMVMGGIALGVSIVGLNVLFPPQTSRVHEEVASPLVSDQPWTALLIRVAVYVPVMIFVFSTGDMNMMIVPLMLFFVCAQPSTDTRMHQVIDRGGGTMVGGLIAALIMVMYSIVPELPVQILLLSAMTYFLIDRMTTGAWRPLRYQNICSTALVMVLSATTTGRDALEVVLQRVVLTAGTMVGAILILAILEAVFLADRSADLPEPAVS
ncbi:FUSC family protein [Devosia submarina]|uniref:FUSC family protein n=1 Tax=Devosia submarina TaxID=1173082 RepID=UPI001300B59D|nr:FUSC family protein [Devosia submarina]